jgi:thiaminase/transcriptional activator TenA
MIFTKMQSAATPIFHHILKLPFNLELANGTLSKDRFIYYLTQDSLYLADYSKALALTAAKLISTHHSQQFLQFAQDAIFAEQNLHLKLLEEHAIPLHAKEKSPTCFMYTNYLLKMVSLAPVEEALASLLPCLWLYREVGLEIAKSHTPENPYQAWIDLYISDAFNQSVNTAIQIINELASNTHETMQTRMIQAFKRSCQLEWLFWNHAYQQETWLLEG